VRIFLFLLSLAFVAAVLEVPPVTAKEGMQLAPQIAQRGGAGGFGRDFSGRASGTKDKKSEINPMLSRAPRAAQEKSGLIATGLRPVYPQDAQCLEVRSPFASRTRFDGSPRREDANHGYHEGMDISAPIGTPLVAIADGEVVHKFHGGRLVGIQIFIRHAPADTGLPVYVYSKYKHFDDMPGFAVGERIRMGQVLGPSGDTGTAGGHFPNGYSHLHLSVYVSDSPDYDKKLKMVVPKDVRQLDPLALFIGSRLAVVSSHAARGLAEAGKDVAIPYKTTGGKVHPAGTRFVWPFLCKLK